MAKSTSKKEQTFESALKRLEEIVEILEQGNAPLDEVMKIYEEGVLLSKQCLTHLNKAELTIKRLSKDVTGQFELIDEQEED